MELNKLFIQVLITTMLVTPFSVLGQDNGEFVHFLDRLQIDGDKEYAEFEKALINASDEEYRAIIVERMKGAFDTPSSMKRLAVIVEITNELTPEQKNTRVQQVIIPRPEQSSQRPSKGVTLLENMFKSESSPLRASQSTEAKPVPAYANLEMVRQNISPSKSRFFQKVEGDFNQVAYETMLTDETITDLYLSTTNNLGAYSETFIATRGRVIPKQHVKQYSEEFIRDGMRKDVDNHFSKKDRGALTVWFKNYNDIKSYEEANEKILEILEDYEQYDYSILSEGLSGFEIVVSKEMMLKLSEDSRIDRVTLYDHKKNEAHEMISEEQY